MTEQDTYLLVLWGPIVVGAIAWCLLDLVAAQRDAKRRSRK